MSDLDKATAALGDLPVPSELDTLKARADQVGLTYHPSIGVDALRRKVNEFLTGTPETADPVVEVSAEQAVQAALAAPVSTVKAPVQAHQATTLEYKPPVEDAPRPKYKTPKAIADELQPTRQEGETLKSLQIRQRDHAMALIRVNVQCFNPSKKEWDGEIFTSGNKLVGMTTKFVPFNTEDGWHVPRIMYNFLRDRECQIFITVKDEKGNKHRRGKMIKEFALEVLEPLTPAELQELKERQALTRAVE